MPTPSKEPKPMGFPEFSKRFDTEEKCRTKLFELRWGKGFVCPRCGHSEYFFNKHRRRYICKKCEHETSITAGTIMDKTHLPLQKWFWAIYLIATDKRGISSNALKNQLSVTYKTAWYLKKRIRQAMSDGLEGTVLQGIIELDDAYFGGPGEGGKRGRGTEKSKVLVGLQVDEDGKPQTLKMQVVQNLRGKTIGKFASANITSGSRIRSDSFRSYRKPLAEKWLHEYQVFDKKSDNLAWLHKMISNAKSWIQGTFHGLPATLLQCHLDEFCWRFNHRWQQERIVDDLIALVLRAKPIRV
jgi:transposase-like protein